MGLIRLDKEKVLDRLHAISRGEGGTVPDFIKDIKNGEYDFKFKSWNR